jgi:hypothetical protein
MSTYAPEGSGSTNLIAGILKPEPPRADPKADELSRDELLREMKWTEDQLQTAGACGFPHARYQVFTRGRYEFKYSRQTVDKWLERIRSLNVR